MIEIISGEKGKGKTKELLAKVNHSVDAASGNIVYETRVRSICTS